MNTKIIAFLATWGLIGTFLTLYLSGLGLPIPEEVTLLASGYIASTGAYSPWAASAVAVLGILAGDSTIYFIGRRWGRRALDGPLRRLLTPERVERAETAFHKRRDWFLFLARFMAGVRIVAYFTAGMLRVRYLRFLLIDMAGALISGPTSVFAAYYLGTYLSPDLIQQRFHIWRNWLVVIVLGLVLLVIVARIVHRDLLSYALGSKATPEAPPAQALSPEASPPQPPPPPQGQPPHELKSG